MWEENRGFLFSEVRENSRRAGIAEARMRRKGGSEEARERKEAAEWAGRQVCVRCVQPGETTENTTPPPLITCPTVPHAPTVPRPASPLSPPPLFSEQALVRRVCERGGLPFMQLLSAEGDRLHVLFFQGQAQQQQLFCHWEACLSQAKAACSWR